MQSCRACLRVDKDLFQVDEQFILSYNLLTNLNVKPFDTIPKCFCQVCMESVNHFIEFRQKCILSETTLQERNATITLDESEIEVDIKKELVDDLNVNSQYELVDSNIKEECVVIETRILDEEDLNPSELNVIEKRPRGRPRGVWKITGQQQKVDKLNVIDNEIYCGLCDDIFIVEDDLTKHLDTHRTDERCGICSKPFENWPKLLAHRAVHSGKKYCHLCLKRFYSQSRLEQHYLDNHFEEKLKEMCCEQCQKTFTCSEKYNRHLETHNIECHICPEMFASKRLLALHLRSHDTKKRHQCDQCEYTAIYADVLASHKARRHKKYSCEICGRKFLEASRLKKHVCNDKSNICPACGERIYDSLTRHMRKHQDAKSFKCEKCPATYKSRLSLTVHMNRHENNPTHACDYCGRKFYYPTTLCKHRRIHTGEKPYVCKICGKRFTGNSNLRMHMKTHGIDLIVKKNKDSDAVPAATQGTSD